MQQDSNSRGQEGDFEDETWDRCVAKITRLQTLINIQEMKLLKAMRNAKNKMVIPSKPV